MVNAVSFYADLGLAGIMELLYLMTWLYLKKSLERLQELKRSGTSWSGMEKVLKEARIYKGPLIVMTLN